VLPCDVIAASCVATHGAVRLGTARHGTEKTPPPPPPRSAYSVARRLTVGYLATFCCVIQQWVDMSQYIYYIVSFRPVGRQRPRNGQLYNSSCYIIAATYAHNRRTVGSGVLCAVRAEAIYRRALCLYERVLRRQ
jgi:hypothetical protein